MLSTQAVAFRIVAAFTCGRGDKWKKQSCGWKLDVFSYKNVYVWTRPQLSPRLSGLFFFRSLETRCLVFNHCYKFKVFLTELMKASTRLSGKTFLGNKYLKNTFRMIEYNSKTIHKDLIQIYFKRCCICNVSETAVRSDCWLT